HLPGRSACISRQPAPVVGIVCGLHQYPPFPTPVDRTPNLPFGSPLRTSKLVSALCTGCERCTDDGIESFQELGKREKPPCAPSSSASRRRRMHEQPANCDQVRR